MRCLAIALLSASALSAQVNARALVRLSIANGSKAWQESRAYSCLKLDVDRQFGAHGAARSTDQDLYRIVPVSGDSIEEHLQHDGQPVSPEEQRKQQKIVERRLHETPAQSAAQLAKEQRERSYYNEIPDAFDFKITGVEKLPTGPAWVLRATPRPGFQPQSRYARMFPKMEGKLWIDQHDVQWVKADAVATDNVYFGYFIARLAKGSHITLEQTRLADGAWVPKRIEARASARTFLFFNHNFQEDITYSDYHRALPGGKSLAAQSRTPGAAR